MGSVLVLDDSSSEDVLRIFEIGGIHSGLRMVLFMIRFEEGFDLIE